MMIDKPVVCDETDNEPLDYAAMTRLISREYQRGGDKQIHVLQERIIELEEEVKRLKEFLGWTE
jgi:hypothetical protein